MLADGGVLECSPAQNPEVFRAAGVSLGALGVISWVTLQNVPSYRLEERVRVVGLGTLLPELPSLARENRHLDCHVFPFSGQTIVKTLNPAQEPAGKTGVNSFVENTVLRWACELSRALPVLNAPLQRLVGVLVGSSRRVGESYRIFATPREVRFNEMEYHVPAERGPECLEEVCAAIRKSGVQVFIPVEYRYVAGDGFWLSPFGGGARASIAVHQYHKQDPWPLFRVVEPILRRHGGRPHWGKMHSLKAGELRELYPHFDDFRRVRLELDPRGKFLNAHLREALGA
ncbi:L-gulono-1,4-lactone dehydrogenase [Calidithermus terrae]|uniref:L-gulono-1,4-lactone dehydrogenase n=1 Tax=Calidithermus terrae TaxID=1408545 RepID=A0A399DTZ5_9DEIN|nr:L-gulono-1,4-lactone dehydrogenase [Calidithermus terrae]